MKSELNNYNINNPDGTSKEKYNEKKTSYNNDSPRYIKENPVAEQDETLNSAETFEDFPQNSDGKNAANQSSSSAISSVSVVSSSIGGSIGVLAGTVAASVMTAVIVVAVFISTLTVNLTLVMASMYSLVFQVEISGAQEEDFINPIFAILEGEDGFYQEQEIFSDSLYISFDNLESGKEYFVIVKNQEKELYKKSFFTSTEQVEEGFISAYCDGGEIFVFVEHIELKANEFYTVTAKDDKGKVVFVKDDVEPSKDFKFRLPDAKSLYFTLSVNGKVYAITKIDVQIESEYDFENGEWSWTEDYGSASVVFRSVNDGPPLTVAAEISESYVEPACESDGKYVYLATATFNGKRFSDERVDTVPNSALGHDYGEQPIFEWVKDNDGGYSATAMVVCSRDRNHKITLPTTVSKDGNVYYAEAEYNGELYTDEYEVSDDFSSVSLALEEGNIYIRPNDYMQSDNSTAGSDYISFVSSEEGPYILSGNISECYSPINVYNSNDSGGYNGTAEDFYIVLDSVSIVAAEQSAIFCISAEKDVNIYITILGEVNLEVYNQTVFSIQGQWSSTVNIYVTCEGDSNLFNYNDSATNTKRLCGYDSSYTVNFYINNELLTFDSNGVPV